MPKYSLDICINFNAKNESGLGSQYFVWSWPFRADHSVDHSSFKLESMEGIIVDLLGVVDLLGIFDLLGVVDLLGIVDLLGSWFVRWLIC